MKIKVPINLGRVSSFLVFLSFLTTLHVSSQAFLYGDPLPDAPVLSARGEFKVGVRTLQLVNPNQIDILNSKDGKEVRYDRPLSVEVWYPADVSSSNAPTITYEEVMGTRGDSLRPLIPFQFKGRALRNAEPTKTSQPYPLIVVSHGYVGSRYLMTYLTENLASKGYIVVAIDHTDSTFRDANAFYSTLLNRAKDIKFVINEMAALKKKKPNEAWAKNIDSNTIGIIGYSMGGYGVLNVAGAGYSDGLTAFFAQMTGGSKAITDLVASNPEYKSQKDERIKAVVAFAPWGMERGVWDLDGLKGLKTPTFFVAGDQDDISGYEKGIKAIYEGSVNTDRYLLTYKNARHNVAPNPPPAEALQPGLSIDEYYRYAEPSWDQRKINNINQHFVTAFLGTYLKGKDYTEYLNISKNSNEKDWPGFKPRSSTGMELIYAEKAN